MKLLYILLLVAASHAAVVVNNVKGHDLKVVTGGGRSIGSTNIYYIVSNDNPLRVTFFWHLLPSPPSDPIRGYKAKIWEQQTKIVESIELIDGVPTVVEKEELIPFPAEVGWEPKEELTIPGSHSNMATFQNLRVGPWYEIRVQAYTWTELGPYSPSWRFRFQPVTLIEN